MDLQSLQNPTLFKLPDLLDFVQGQWELMKSTTKLLNREESMEEEEREEKTNKHKNQILKLSTQKYACTPEFQNKR